MAPFADYPNIDSGDLGAQQRYSYFVFVRDDMLFALALVAMPFALVAAWRAAMPGRVRWLTAWWLLSLAVLLVTLRATLLVLHANPPPGATYFVVKYFEENVGLGPYIMALGILLLGLGLLGMWRRTNSPTA